MSILLAVTALALLALTTAVVWAGRVVSRTYEPRATVGDRSPTQNQLNTVQADLATVQDDLKSLTLAVAEGIERVSRAENRIAKTVTSAKRLVANAGLEHAGIEAEDQELRERDGEGSEDAPLPYVQGVLELDGPSGIPGMSRSELRAFRGA